ncbi:MAG: nitroreductase family protein [Anaerolineae bacterium]|nr:nitroreductase family protein [Anaerolineae bacterium]
MLKELVRTCRSYRRFYEDHALDEETLRELVDLARLAASGHNAQPLKYLLSWAPEKNSLIFPHLTWAAYLKDWPGPSEGERPSAYIIVLGDTEIRKSFTFDQGIAAQNILLGAREKGLGGCILAAINRDGLREDLGIADRYEILFVLALGKPKEKVVLEVLEPGGDVRYWRDAEGVHHVPKRTLEEIIVG